MAIKLTNNATSTLAASITSGSATLSVQTADAGKFPTLGAGDWFPLTVVDTAGNMEVMRVTARAGAVLTISRGQEGTTAKAFSAGARVDVRLTAATLEPALREATGLLAGLMSAADKAKIDTVSNNANQTNVSTVGAAVAAANGQSSVDDAQSVTGVLAGASTLVKWTWGTVKAWVKSWINELPLAILDQGASGAFAVGRTASTGAVGRIVLSSAATASTIAYRGANGVLLVGAPTADTHAATKKYVDDNTKPTNKRIYLSSATWTKPAGLSKVIVTVLGAGGGGGGAYRSGAGAVSGGAGGSGAAAIREIAAGSLGATVSVSVGAAGIGGKSSPYNGTDGGTSSFGAFVQATGGKGGTVGNNTTGTPTGTKGDNGVASGSGAILLQPAVILHSVPTPDNNGLGWNAATSLANNANADGQVTRGCGGPGAVTSTNGMFFGGDGAPGLVIVEEYF